MKKVFILLLIFFMVSCADQYSSRTRSASSRNYPFKPTTKRGGIIDSHRGRMASSQQVYDNNSPRAVVELPADTPVLDAPDATSINFRIRKMLDEAYSYLGTPYKYGGTSRLGVDCSGLVGNAYREVDIPLARSASGMSEQGKSVSISNVQVGDLLFFATRRGRKISHVGIVVEVGNEVKFIHSSTSQGVIISSLEEGYWKSAFRKAKRVL